MVAHIPVPEQGVTHLEQGASAPIYRNRRFDMEGGSLPKFTGQMVEKSRKRPWGPGFPLSEVHRGTAPAWPHNQHCSAHGFTALRSCSFGPVPRLSVPRRKSGQLLTQPSAAPLSKGPSREEVCTPRTCHVSLTLQTCVAPDWPHWGPLPGTPYLLFQQVLAESREPGEENVIFDTEARPSAQ